MSKLGEILINEFGWSPEAVGRALETQRNDRTPKACGEYFRKEAGNGTSQAGYQVALALLLQRHAHGGTSGSRDFDTLEYRELGELYRFERVDIARRLRAYALLCIALFAFIAYPLAFALDGHAELRSSDAPNQGLVTSERPSAGAAGREAASSQVPSSSGGAAVSTDRFANSGLLYAYGLLGLALVGFLVFFGDNIVKAYGEFLKRRLRISSARATIRGQLVQAGRASKTAMPWRDPVVGTSVDGEPLERSDPELRGLQKHLVLHYSVWSLVKGGLAVYFVALLKQGSFRLSSESLVVSVLWSVGVLGPLWLYFLSKACVRHAKIVKEAHAITPENLYPRYSTRVLKRVPGFSHRMWAFRALHAVLLGVMATTAVRGASAAGINGEAWSMTGTFMGTFVCLCLARILQVHLITDKMQMLNGAQLTAGSATAGAPGV